MTARRGLLAAGLIVSAAFLAAILWRLNWQAFVAEFHNIRYPWLVVSMLCIASTLALRALRWNLAAGLPVSKYPAVWSSAAIGFALNQVYPLRAGEVIRIFTLRTMAGIPLGRAATGALIDRLADTFLLGLCSLAVVAVHTGLTYAEKLATVGVALAFAAFAAIALFSRGDKVWRRWFGRWGRKVPEILAGRIQRFYEAALLTSAQIASPVRLAMIIGLTTVAFAIDLAVFYTVMMSLGWALPPMAAVTVLVFLAVGTSLPSAPGYAGVYQLACVLALALFGVAEASAVAYSIIVQLCVLATSIPLAALAAAAHREELRAARGEMPKGI